MRNHHVVIKYLACLVLVSYSTVFIGSQAFATEWQLTYHPRLVAQTSSTSGQERGLKVGDPSKSGTSPTLPQQSPTISAEEMNALQQIYTERIREIEAGIDTDKGIRKNLLSVAVAAFSIGTTVAFAVNTVNDSIDKIPVDNPEAQPDGSCSIPDRYDACCEYISYNEEKRDAQDSLDGIKGIGGGIFIAGAISLAGYFLYTRNIRAKQQKIEAIRMESEERFERKGLTPAYLQQNESVAVVMEEIDELKHKAGRSRTTSEIFSRFALGGLASGLFLMGVSNVSHTIVDDITIDESDPDDVAAKNDALDKTDDLKKVGAVLLGVGAASGVASFLFGRFAKKNDTQIDELRKSILRIAGNIDIYPRADGFMVMYSYSF